MPTQNPKPWSIKERENPETIAVHKGRFLEGIEKFIPLSLFPSKFQKEYNAGTIYCVFYDYSNSLKYEDIWRKVHSVTLKKVSN